MPKESDVEKYLHSEVTKIGGTTRKWVSPNYVGVPDRIVILQGGEVWVNQVTGAIRTDGIVDFVEVKTEIGKLSAMQEREIKRLRGFGCHVEVVYGKKGVDLYVENLVKRLSK